MGKLPKEVIRLLPRSRFGEALELRGTGVDRVAVFEWNGQIVVRHRWFRNGPVRGVSVESGEEIYVVDSDPRPSI